MIAATFMVLHPRVQKEIISEFVSAITIVFNLITKSFAAAYADDPAVTLVLPGIVIILAAVFCAQCRNGFRRHFTVDNKVKKAGASTRIISTYAVQ